MLLGHLGLRGLISLMPEDTPRWISFQMDARFAVFCLAITSAAAVLFGLVPALQAARVDTRGCLQDAAPRSTLSRGRRGTLSALVASEIALALMLLICAGLLVEAFRRVLRVDPGFRPENAGHLQHRASADQYGKPEQQVTFFQNLLERLRALPGVKSAGAASAPPLGGHWGMFLTARARARWVRTSRTRWSCMWSRRRGISRRDRRDVPGRASVRGARRGPKGPQVAIVNESFAKRFWPTADAPGKRIRYSWKKDEWM